MHCFKSLRFIMKWQQTKSNEKTITFVHSEIWKRILTVDKFFLLENNGKTYFVIMSDSNCIKIMSLFIVSVLRTINNNSTSEFPDIVSYPKYSFLWPFWTSFLSFSVDISGNSEFVLKNSRSRRTLIIEARRNKRRRKLLCKSRCFNTCLFLHFL